MKKCPKCGTTFEGKPEKCPSCGAHFVYQKKEETTEGNLVWQQAHSADAVKIKEPNLSNSGPLKTNRGFVKFVFFSIITVGIYGLVYMSRYNKDLNRIRLYFKEKKKAGLILMIILSTITLSIYGIYWLIVRVTDTYRYADKSQSGSSGSAAWVIISHTLLIWTLICPIIGAIQLISTMNDLCRTMNPRLIEQQNRLAI